MCHNESTGMPRKGIQLVTISRPTAYGEYAPYTFIESEKEFEDLVQKMAVEG